MADGRVTFEIRLKDQITAALERISSRGLAAARTLKQRLAGALAAVGTAFKKLRGVINSQVSSIVSGIVGIGAAFTALRSGFKRGIEFDRSIAEIKTIMDESTMSISQAEQMIRKLALELGKPAPEVAKGFYQILSAGITDAADASEVLRGSLELSTAGLSTSTEAVNLLTSAFNAYKMEVSGETVAATNDLLFKMVELGRVTIPEAAASLGRLMPSAAALQVPLEEVGAAVATLTLNGLSVAEAVTQVNAVLTAFLRKGELSRDMFGQFSDVMGASVIKAKGLQGAMQGLSDAVGGSEDKLQQVMGRVEGVRAVMSLTGNQSEKFTDTIDKLTNSAGANTRAFETMQNTLSTKIGILSEAFVQDLGDMSVAMLGFLETLDPDEVARIGQDLSASTQIITRQLSGLLVNLAVGASAIMNSVDAVFEGTISTFKNFGKDIEGAAEAYIRGVNLMSEAAPEDIRIGEDLTTDDIEEYIRTFDRIRKGRIAWMSLADAYALANGEQASYTELIREARRETFSYRKAVIDQEKALSDYTQQLEALRSLGEGEILASDALMSDNEQLASINSLLEAAKDSAKRFNDTLAETNLPGSVGVAPIDLSAVEAEFARIRELIVGTTPTLEVEVEPRSLSEMASDLVTAIRGGGTEASRALADILSRSFEAFKTGYPLVSEEDVTLAKMRVKETEDALSISQLRRMDGLTKEREKIEGVAEVEKKKFQAEQLARYQTLQAILKEQEAGEEATKVQLQAFLRASRERVMAFNAARDRQTRAELRALKVEQNARKAELRKAGREVERFAKKLYDTVVSQGRKTAADLFGDLGGAFRDLQNLAVISPDIEFDTVQAQVDAARQQLQKGFYEVDGVAVRINDTTRAAIEGLLRMIEVTNEASRSVGSSVAETMTQAGAAIALLAQDIEETPFERLEEKLRLIEIARKQLADQPLISPEDRAAIEEAIDKLEKMYLVEERVASRGTALMRSLGGAIGSLAEKVATVPELKLADSLEKIARAREQLQTIDALTPEQREEIEFLLRSIENVEVSAARAAAGGTAALQNAGGALASLQGDVTVTPQMRLADLQNKIAAAKSQLAGMGEVDPAQAEALNGYIANVEKFALAQAEVEAALAGTNEGVDTFMGVVGELGDGMKEALAPFADIEQAINDIGEAATKQLAAGLTDALMSIAVEGESAEEAFKKFAAAFLADIARMIIQLLIYRAIRQMVLGFEDGGTVEGGTGEMEAVGLANGGIVSGGLGRALPVKGYASGGPIVREPHIALIGEGKMNEAVVPLPDGRSIPVEMRGQSESTSISINIEAVDAPSVDRLLFQRRGTLSSIIQRALREDRALRNAVGGI